MNVEELIKQLKQFPSNYNVAMVDYLPITTLYVDDEHQAILLSDYVELIGENKNEN